MKIGINARNLSSEVTGIGRYVIELSRQLALKGHEVFLYLPAKPTVSLPEWPGVVVRSGNYTGGIQRLVWGEVVLPRLAKEDGVDIFWGPAHRLPCFLDRRIPRVVTIHDLVWIHVPSTMRFRTWLAECMLMKSALRSANRIIADSYATATTIKSYLPNVKDKIKVIYPGLTIMKSDSPKELSDVFFESHRIGSPYLLFVGTLEPRKNLLRLLKAYAMLPQKLRDKLPLVIAGGQGWHLGDLSNQISQLGIKSYVRLTGYVSDEELEKLYANARFLVMPSLYEGFGFPIIEANAAGVPVLTSNIASMPEVVGDAGLLINPNDTKAIADAMWKLATDDCLYHRLQINSRANAERFSWNESADLLIEAFNDAIEEHKRNTLSKDNN